MGYWQEVRRGAESRVRGKVAHYGLFVTILLLAACQSSTGVSENNRFSGVIEGTKADVVAELGGRITAIAVDEGEAVTAGQSIVTLDDAVLAAQVKQAQAAVTAAQANREQVKAGTRAAALQVAEAAVQEAQADQLGAQALLSNTQQLRTNPQQVNAQIDALRSGVKLAEQNVAVAQTKLTEARYWRDFYDQDKQKHETLDKQIAIAQKNLEAAQAQANGVQAQLGAVQALRDNPLMLDAQVNQARNAYSLTLASLAVARANLTELQAGPAPEALAVADAQLAQAQAQLKLAQAYHSRTAIAAPLTGFVAARSAQVGESVSPGSPLLSLVNVDTVDMTIYVPQAQLPRVQVGAPVKVYVDAYPADVFTGEVASIAQQAQFSSRNTQNKDDRTNIVFAVKVRLDNADKRLKAGMTADAEMEWQ